MESVLLFLPKCTLFFSKYVFFTCISPSLPPLAGDQGAHVGRELQDHDGGRAADGAAGAGQPAG